jgi:cellulose synthase/poly-beta-1,6-N-acetylglucosamine synthase-like glycosyltransferase
MIALACIFVLLSVLVLAVRYVWGSILKWHHPHLHTVVKDYSLQPTCSVLLPVFMEGPGVYDTIQSIRESDYPIGRLEVIAIDDASSDDSYEHMLRAAQDFPNVRVYRNPENLGKNRTVLKALMLSQADMVISIDSDTVFAPDTVKELMSCFADPKMGAVGGTVGIRNANDNAITKFQAVQYFLAYHLGKIPENFTKTVGCISGCLFAIRRKVYLEIEPKMAARHFFGIPTSQGEDRRATHEVVLRGYHTYVNLDAQCWTLAPNTLKGYLRQQLRWRQSSLHDFFYTIRTLPLHVRMPFNVLYVFLLLPLTTYLALFRIAIGLIENPLWWMDPRPLLVYMLMSILVCFAIKKRNPEQAIENPLALAMFGAFWIVSTVFITILASWTLDSSDWGTRVSTPQPIQETQAIAIEEVA